MRRNRFALLALAVAAIMPVVSGGTPFHVTYLWHMHQPIYYPYENVRDTDSNARFNFHIESHVWDGDRISAYRNWPKNAVQQGHDRGMLHAGAQMSYSGSLVENNRNLWGAYGGWAGDVRWGRNGIKTTRGNPRLDVVGIAHHHSLMPLTSKESMIMQVRLHKEQYKEVWDTGGEYSKGFWPPECAFDKSVIPALVQEGLQWVIVDNGHLFRAVPDFPWSSASSCRPNPAEVRNPGSTELNSQWVQLQNVWAPTKVLAPWAYQPHYVRYVNPWTGQEQKIVAVPAGRYEGNENGRGGYGAFKPENVWGPHASVNNNDAKPMLVLCHSDGDNYGMKNADAWHGQHGNFLNMVQADSNFEHTSIQDYLELYPPDPNDVIHVEPGSWIGIDGGTPYYEKWLSYENRDGEMPDMWSWSVLVAANNRVLHADSLENSYLNLADGRTMDDVEWGINNDTARAWRFYLNGETSCYWYWDFDRANPWDGNVTRACNLAVTEAMKVINRHPGVDTRAPSIFPPQRSPYNPGGKMWDETENASSDFMVWSFVDDVSGLAAVRLYWRTEDYQSFRELTNTAHEVYAHTPGKNSAWNTVPMSGEWWPSVKGPMVPDPMNRAMRYTGWVNGQNNALIGYFVEAVDAKGNTNRSDIVHVWVGESNSTNNPASHVTFDPEAPDGCDSVTISYRKADSPLGAQQVYIHIGRNGWKDVVDPAPAMTSSGDYWTYVYNPPGNTLQIDVAFKNAEDEWDNNNGSDWHIAVANCGSDATVAFSDDPRDCEPLIVTYSAAGGILTNVSPVHQAITFDGGATWTTNQMYSADSATWVCTNSVPDNAPGAAVRFGDAAGSLIDDNGGANWFVSIRDCDAPSGAVWTVPESPNGCDPVTIWYNPSGRVLQNASQVYIHRGYNGWTGATPPGHEMTRSGNYWFHEYTPTPGTHVIDFCFNDGGTTWDSNGGADWHVAVSNCVSENAGIVITNPAARITSVANAISNWTIRGTAGSAVTGELSWTNALTQAGGSTPFAASWSIPDVALDVGTNVVSVIGGTASGTTSDTVRIVRYASDGPQPPTDFCITSPASDIVVSYAVGSCAIHGYGDDAVGSIVWTNELSGASGSGDAASSWTIAGIPLAVGVNVITVSATNSVANSTTTNAADSAGNPAYDSGWASDSNGGSGFGGWILYRDTENGAEAGHFIADAATNLSIGSRAWGLYANSGKLAEAKRPFASPLQIGQTFKVKMDNGHVDAAHGAGVALQNSNGDTLWSFWFNGGDANYSMTDGSTDIGWTSHGIEIELTLTGASTFTVRILPYGSNLRTYSGNLEANADQSISQFRAWNYSTGSGDDANVYINDLEIVTPSAGAGDTYSDSVSITRALESQLWQFDSNNDGIPDGWYAQHSIDPLWNHAAQFDSDGDGYSNSDEYIADTDPRSADSFFMLKSPGEWPAILSFDGSTACVYNVFFSSNLLAAQWIHLLTNVPGTNSVMSITEDRELQSGCYRISVERH